MNLRLFTFTLKRHLLMLRLLTKSNGSERGTLLKREEAFAHIGENFWYEPSKLPAEPKLVSVGDNVNIASDVAIVNHDILSLLINHMENDKIVHMRKGGGNYW